MDIYNIKQVSKRVDKKLNISYDRLYRFFTGNYSVLDEKELEAVEKVLTSQHKEAMSIVKTAKAKLTPTNK